MTVALAAAAIPVATEIAAVTAPIPIAIAASAFTTIGCSDANSVIAFRTAVPPS